MSYQVLARKWRPHTFEQVVGQQHVLTALTNALDQGRLHHAYLLSGTRGVGKTTIARILAKSLNCEQGIGSKPCGVCDTCREIDQGNFVDLLEIDAASRTKVEDTRELLDNVQYRPARGRFKVYLIDEVHMLSRHSFNALLKTLEEPPSYVKFLLATTDPQKLPITILSRCLQFHLKSLDQTQIGRQLAWVLEQEGQAFEPRALQALAKAADGSMRDALSLTDQALAHGNGSVLLESVLTMLGTLDHHHLHQLLEAVLRQDAPATMAKIGEIATLGPDFDQLHAELEALLHRVAMAQLLPASVQEQGADADALLQLARAMSPEEVQLCYQIVLGGRKDLPWAPDGRTALEMTCLRMLAFSPRREAMHPAQLGVLPAGIPVTNVGQEAIAAPGKSGAEPASATPVSAVTAVAEPVAQAGNAMAEAMASDRAQENVGESTGKIAEKEAEESTRLFAEQDELLRAAGQMGYEGSAAPVSAPATDPEPSVIASMQSLLGKRNLLRSRQRVDGAPATPVTRTVPAKPVAAKPAQPSSDWPPRPRGAPQATEVQAPASPRFASGYDLPPLDAYDESDSDSGDYEAYLDQGFAASGASPAPLPTPAAELRGRRPDPANLPPWDLGESAVRAGTNSQAPTAQAAVVPAATPVAPATSVLETIDWNELDSDDEPQEGEASRLHPASLLANCGDPWAELIARTSIGGRLRQLAINAVMAREGARVLLTLKPEQRHLANDKVCGDLAQIIGPEFGMAVQVEVTLGTVPECETPLEIEQRLYLAVREQAGRDLEQDPHVQFLMQRFGAVLHHESIEPLNR